MSSSACSTTTRGARSTTSSSTPWAACRLVDKSKRRPGSSLPKLRYEFCDQPPYRHYHGHQRHEIASDVSPSRRKVKSMHLPDAVLDPRVAAATYAAGGAGLVYCLRAVERQFRDRTTSVMGMMSAFIFAAQMVNFPVGPGVSGHLLGGVLAAVMLGPWAGATVIAAVLIVQCFLFGDGGLTALGANFVNMGLIGSVVGYAIYAPIRRKIGGRRGILIGAMTAAWFTVLLAAGACAIELSISGRRG